MVQKKTASTVHRPDYKQETLLVDLPIARRSLWDYARRDVGTLEIMSRLDVCTMCCSPIILPVSIAMTVLGAKYPNDCPASPNLPYFTLGYGVSLQVYIVGRVVMDCIEMVMALKADRKSQYEEDEGKEDNCVQFYCKNLFSLFFTLLGLSNLAYNFIYCVMVFRMWRPSFEEGSIGYCNQTLYMFAFIYCCSSLVLLGIFLICLCCTCTLVMCFFCVQMLFVPLSEVPGRSKTQSQQQQPAKEKKLNQRRIISVQEINTCPC